MGVGDRRRRAATGDSTQLLFASHTYVLYHQETRDKAWELSEVLTVQQYKFLGSFVMDGVLYMGDFFLIFGQVLLYTSTGGMIAWS